LNERQATAILMGNLKGTKNKPADLIKLSNACQFMIKKWGIKEVSIFFGVSEYMLRQIEKINHLDSATKKFIQKNKLGIEKSYQLLDKTLSDSRKSIKFQNSHLQKNIMEQLELSFCKMLEYIRDQSDFLKRYIGELRELNSGNFSAVLLDALYDAVQQTKRDTVIIRRVFEDAKEELRDEDHLEELNLIIFHSTEINEIIRSLDRMEEILFSYPPLKG